MFKIMSTLFVVVISGACLAMDQEVNTPLYLITKTSLSAASARTKNTLPKTTSGKTKAYVSRREQTARNARRVGNRHANLRKDGKLDQRPRGGR